MDTVYDKNRIDDTDDARASALADDALALPLAEQVDRANAAITDQLRLLAATEGQISDAMANRDVEAIVRLRATRDALASVIRAMRADRDALSAKRLAQLAQEAREQREAAFDKLPTHETYIDPTDGQSVITRIRFRI